MRKPPKFLICDYLPDDPYIYLYHGERPRLMIRVERTQDKDAYGFHIADIMDTVDENGEFYTDDVFKKVAKEMAAAFDEYIKWAAKNKIQLNRFSQEN